MCWRRLGVFQRKQARTRVRWASSTSGLVGVVAVAVAASLCPPHADAGSVGFIGYVFPSKESVQAESTLAIDTKTGDRQRGKVDPVLHTYSVSLNDHNANDSVAIKVITQAKDTVAETFDIGPSNTVRSLPTLFADGYGLDIRHAITATGESLYGRCNIVGYPDTTYARLQSKTGVNPLFVVGFDGTKLTGFGPGEDFRIDLRLRDSSAVSIGAIEGIFVDADTAPNVTLALAPGFRDVAITRHAGLPDTVEAGDTLPVNVSMRNYSDLRDEDVTVVMTRRRDGVALDSASATVTLRPPHFPPDTALVAFPDWQVAPSDSGENIISYEVVPSDSVPNNNLRSETTFVRGYVSGIVGESQSRTSRVLPTILRAPVDLRRFDGELRDVLGRCVASARLEAGVYYLVAPGRTRKLLVVD